MISRKCSDEVNFRELGLGVRLSFGSGQLSKKTCSRYFCKTVLLFSTTVKTVPSKRDLYDVLISLQKDNFVLFVIKYCLREGKNFSNGEACEGGHQQVP